MLRPRRYCSINVPSMEYAIPCGTLYMMEFAQHATQTSKTVCVVLHTLAMQGGAIAEIRLLPVGCHSSRRRWYVNWMRRTDACAGMLDGLDGRITLLCLRRLTRGVRLLAESHVFPRGCDANRFCALQFSVIFT